MKILDVIESKKALLPYSGKEEQAWALDPGELVYTLDLKFQNLRSLVSLLRVFDVEPRYLSLGPKIVSLNVSTNLITTFLPLASKFPNLRHVNASLNQLETLEGLSSLAECRHLNVANNYLHEFRSLRESLPHLTFLDASFNQLDTLHTNPDVLTFLPPTLVELRLVGNVHLHTVRGISKACPNLNILHLQKNKLVDIDPLAGMTSLRELSVASNHISDLTQLASVIFTLTNLAQLQCYGNPVEGEDTYHFRLLQNLTIVKLDHKDIRPHLRDQLADIHAHEKLHGLVEKTTQEYTTRIQREQDILNQGMNFYRTRQEMMITSFSQYKQSMEHELEECVSYADKLKSSKDQSFLLSKAGIQEWERRLATSLKARELEDQERLALEMKLKSSQLEHQSKRVDIHQKLRALAHARPDIWQAMKNQELQRSEVEEQIARQAEVDKSRRIQESREQIKQERETRTKEALSMAQTFKLEKPQKLK